MKRLISYVPILLLFAGCGTTQVREPSHDQPEVISMAPLPAFPLVFPGGGLKFTVLLHVLEDGSVGEATMVGTSGVAEWDALAVQSIKHWKFNPAHQNGVTVASWLRQAIIVQVQEPIIEFLGELVLPRREMADSLYGLLKSGISFETLAKQSESASRDHCGYLGAVDIAIFPKHIREQLKTLAIDDVTAPMRIGEDYVIYKRFKKDGPKAVEQ